MYLDLVYMYIEVHSKINVSRKAKTSYNLESREYYSEGAAGVGVGLCLNE